MSQEAIESLLREERKFEAAPARAKDAKPVFEEVKAGEFTIRLPEDWRVRAYDTKPGNVRLHLYLPGVATRCTIAFVDQGIDVLRAAFTPDR